MGNELGCMYDEDGFICDEYGNRHCKSYKQDPIPGYTCIDLRYSISNQPEKQYIDSREILKDKQFKSMGNI